MTPLDLLDEMKIYIEQQTKDLILPTRMDRRSGETPERPAEVHTMALPNKKAETERIPYVLLQFLTSKDQQEPGEMPESSCKIRIVAATYSEDKAEGSRCLLNLLTRIRLAFLRDGSIADRYLLKIRKEQPLEMIIYPDSPAPYYLGEMMTEWTLPPVNIECPFSG
ncbi:MAG: hypothetical protein HDT37_00605 [Clostridiales bacterium]|nr:hypothetical protein [Clostridiales bacterium]